MSHGPKHKHKHILLGLITLGLLIAIPASLCAQITSAGADKVDSLALPVSGGKIPLFVFHQNYGVEVPGSLEASHPSGSSYRFEWSMFNPLTMGYDPPFQTDDNIASSSVSGLESGGYQVRISGSGVDTSMVAWLWQDRLTARVDKDAMGNLPTVQRTCDYLYLMGYAEPDTLVYYDPGHPDPLVAPIEFRFLWTSDNADLDIPNADKILAPNITYAPPYRDTWYILTVSDSLGMVAVDSVFYESIQTKADFTVTYFDKVLSTKDTVIWDPDLTGSWSIEKGSLDATLTVQFINESENGEEFQWVFVDTTGAPREEETTWDVDDQPEFTYINADKRYYPMLTSISTEGCVDSIRLEEGIHVEGSQLEIPNVFAPNSSNENTRIWRFKHQSIKTCKITIVDRTGKVVYKQDIADIYQWEGWDGTIKDSNRKAPTGAYYFVVDALGYDGLTYSDPTIWSQMKIFGGSGRNSSSSTGGTGGTGTEEETPSGLYTGWVYLYR